VISRVLFPRGGGRVVVTLIYKRLLWSLVHTSFPGSVLEGKGREVGNEVDTHLAGEEYML
jgi:hypothetical protein